MNQLPSEFLNRYGDTEHCLRLLERSRRELLHLAEGLSDEQFFTRRKPEQWSPAEEMEHIGLVEESGGKVIRMLRKVAQGQMPLPPAASSGETRPDGRPKAPPAVEPKGGLSRQEVLDKLRAVRERLLLEVAESGAGIAAPPTFRHPFFGNLTAQGWLQTLVYNEQHHVKQIKDRLNE